MLTLSDIVKRLNIDALVCILCPSVRVVSLQTLVKERSALHSLRLAGARRLNRLDRSGSGLECQSEPVRDR